MIDDDGNGYIDDKYGYDFADNDSDPMDTDSDGHGTHVAGIAAAKGNNGLGIAGVSWNARIMILKVQKDGAYSFESGDVIEALAYAQNKGARIINCSFGGASYDQLEYDAFVDLESADVLAVCAAGNNIANNDNDSKFSRKYPSA